MLCCAVQVAGISRIMIGGEHERWEVPPRVTAEEELGWDADEANGRPKREHGQAPKVTQGGQGLQRHCRDLPAAQQLCLVYGLSVCHNQTHKQAVAIPHLTHTHVHGLDGTVHARHRGSMWRCCCGGAAACLLVSSATNTAHCYI